ncbi:MAG: DEAD/DEAH box helicase family protein [Chloroflexota bacterium]
MAIEEYPTDNGPADYALCVGGQIVGIVEAKRLAVGPQNVLTQAERYARGVTGSPFDYQGLRVPFLYATNGEVIWHHDVRHPLERSRQLRGFHTPAALTEALGRDLDVAVQRLGGLPSDRRGLRPYQREACTAVEEAVGARKRRMLVAMATGTGKTFTTVNLVHRLMKAGVARRVLFLVDRRALAAQAVRAFAAFDAEPGLKFNQVYEVYSQRISLPGDADDGFDATAVPQTYLTEPPSGAAYVYVATVQRIAINLFGRDAVSGGQDSSIGGETIDEDAGQLPIPIHAFDLIVADECHRGYTSKELSTWRDTLEHFDAVRIGLTATPAKHTTAYFTDVVYRYGFERAVREGYLVDYDVVTIASDVRLHGVFLDEGEQVDVVDPTTGARQLDFLEDERQFDTTDVERVVTAPDSNRRILAEIKQYADRHQTEYGRFPKTLIFAVNDLPHTSHADQLVDLARDVFGRGDSFVTKITGKVDRPLQRIREFRNEEEPGIALTVDLLTTGVDVPDLEYVVFLRPVKSRILFEQMLGRGTRLGDRYHRDSVSGGYPGKSHFTVFDCFDGTLLAYFRQATGITAEPPERESRPIRELIEAIWDNRDRAYNTRCLVKRLQRIDKEMSGEAREAFAEHIRDGDLADFAARLPELLNAQFTATMKVLRDPALQDLLVNYKRPQRGFLIASGVEDTVTSAWLVRGADGTEYKPEDYLAAFTRWVRENPEQVEAVRVLLDRPEEWTAEALAELWEKLRAAPERFTLENLRRVHERQYQKALVDVISMVKHAANEASPLLTADERVRAALARLTEGRELTPAQQGWLAKIGEVLVGSLAIGREHFEEMPGLANAGGWGRANREFGGKLADLIRELNREIAA